MIIIHVQVLLSWLFFITIAISILLMAISIPDATEGTYGAKEAFILGAVLGLIGLIGFTILHPIQFVW